MSSSHVYLSGCSEGPCANMPFAKIKNATPMINCIFTPPQRSSDSRPSCLFWRSLTVRNTVFAILTDIRQTGNPADRECEQGDALTVQVNTLPFCYPKEIAGTAQARAG